jgi:hypothetical protein
VAFGAALERDFSKNSRNAFLFQKKDIPLHPR